MLPATTRIEDFDQFMKILWLTGNIGRGMIIRETLGREHATGSCGPARAPGRTLRSNDTPGVIASTLVLTSAKSHMPDDKTPTESNRITAEKERKEAEDLREEADQERGTAEEHRAVAESSRTEAERFRVLADEARTLRERYREEMEAVRQEREALRHAAEEARQAAEEARHATIAAVAATADALSANLAQMQFLEDARNTLRQLKRTKPGDVQ